MSVYFHRPLGRPPSVSIRLLAAVLAVTLAGLAPAAAQETALAARADAAPAQTSDAGSGSAAASYRLGPGELISLRVVVWDSVELSFVDLEAISGTYTIGPDGAVMLPILGTVSAAGTTTSVLAETVAGSLKALTGLSEAPSVAIGIERYRPVFVLGDVARPGEYPYRPGMRAVQLLALSGGFFRLTDEIGSGLLREGIRVSGTLRELRVDMVTARIREARLLAEAVDGTSFLRPEGLIHPDGEAAIDEILAREQALMTARRQSRESQVASLESSRTLLETEVRILAEKQVGIDGQVEMMSEAVGNLAALVEQGLLRSPNFLSSQRALMDLEARQLDTENQVFRARQSLGEIERDINDLVQRHKTEVLNELQTLQAQIARLQVRNDTQSRILAETQAEAALLVEEEGAEADLVPVFRVSRETEEGLVTEVVTSDRLLQPLDVLEVRWTAPEDVPANVSAQ
ncbi:MAG: polysaccharide biosynthesis/export family protein [Pseudomonadota bacterium]